jgi:6-phosphofructokinase 1
MKRIAVLTSGGDAPGMNAAIRAVVRAGLEKAWDVFGVEHGFAGLIAGNFRNLGARDVGGILQRGGTILGSARCLEFKTEAGRSKAIRQLNQRGVEAVVVIGGNGTQTGSHALSEAGFPVVGVASTIDNDLYGSEVTIGVDTALNIAIEAIDRLKVTASSHQRAMLVEVMGRGSGYLALMSGIAGGAEAVVIPEVETDPAVLAEEIHRAYRRGKPHAIIVVAEGAKPNAQGFAEYVADHGAQLGFELRVTILGHTQRGGTPTFADRLLASRLGTAAVEQIDAGNCGVLVGIEKGGIVTTPYAEVISKKKYLDPELIELARVLSK